MVRSYVTLRDGASRQDGSAARLLRFYSVECGLKAAILGKNGLNARGTASLPEQLRNHDLRALAKELKLEASLVRQLSGCRRRHQEASPVEPKDLHQAWRYGAALHEEDEKSAEATLVALSEWCRKEHNR